MSTTSSAFRGIDLIIGFGNPISSKDMIFNCHFLMNKYEWDESVTFSNLLKLKYSIDYEKMHVFPLKHQGNSSSLRAFYDFHEKFSQDFTEKTFLQKYLTLLREDENDLGSIALRRHDMPYFKHILSQVESWILYLLNHLIDFSTEIRNSCQHFFFTSTISASCFRVLLKSKEEIDSLLDEIQSVKSIVLEKASSGSLSGSSSTRPGIAGSGLMRSPSWNGSDNGRPSSDDSRHSQKSNHVSSSGLPPPHHGSRKADSSVSSTAVSPPAYPSALGYNPLDHLTVVSTPSYHAESNYTTAIIPTAVTSITLPPSSSTSSDEDSPKMMIRGQPLSASSPLAMKLAALKEASLEKKIADGKLVGNGRENTDKNASSSVPVVASEKSTIFTKATATMPPAVIPPSIEESGMGDESSPFSSEKIDRMIRLLTEEGINCLFFIPTNNANEGSKICPAKVLIKHYIPGASSVSSSSASLASASSASDSSDGKGGKKEKTSQKEEKTSDKAYDPSTCLLELHLNSEELHVNCVLSFPILHEVERAFSGKGVSVLPPASFPVSSLFHILIKKKPEVLLSSLSDPTASAAVAASSPQELILAFNTVFTDLRRFSDKKVVATTGEKGENASPVIKEEKTEKTSRNSIFSKLGGMLSSSPSSTSKKQGNFHFNMDEKLEKLDENKIRLNLIDSTNKSGGKNTNKNVTQTLRTMNDPSIITIQLFFWIQVNEGRLFSSKKKTKLLIVTSDRMIEMYKVPKELDSESSSSSPSSVSSPSFPSSLINNESNETLRISISKKLEQMKRSKFLRSPLIELGFTVEVNACLNRCYLCNRCLFVCFPFRKRILLMLFDVKKIVMKIMKIILLLFWLQEGK
jgi:hypothetical protein